MSIANVQDWIEEVDKRNERKRVREGGREREKEGGRERREREREKRDVFESAAGEFKGLLCHLVAST